ncbi:hypothetical protein ES703_112335 [subsurface metagenome]
MVEKTQQQLNIHLPAVDTIILQVVIIPLLAAVYSTLQVVIIHLLLVAGQRQIIQGPLYGQMVRALISLQLMMTNS